MTYLAKLRKGDNMPASATLNIFDYINDLHISLYKEKGGNPIDIAHDLSESISALVKNFICRPLAELLIRQSKEYELINSKYIRQNSQASYHYNIILNSSLNQCFIITEVPDLPTAKDYFILSQESLPHFIKTNTPHNYED